MVRRRSRSTLFPYTTLFRSRAFLVEGEDVVAEFAGLSRATRRGVLRIEIKRHPFALVIGERMPLAVLVLQAEGGGLAAHLRNRGRGCQRERTECREQPHGRFRELRHHSNLHGVRDWAPGACHVNARTSTLTS